MAAKKLKSSGKKAAKYVYLFGNGKADGDGKMKPLLGGKGANLAEMTPHRPAGAAGFHDHHGSLHVLLREQTDVSRRRSRRR